MTQRVQFMRFRSHQCWFPRDPDSPGFYEDACAISEKAGRVVIADGVSSAIFSRTWARLLTRTAVKDPPYTHDSTAVSKWLEPLQEEWRKAINYDVVVRDIFRGRKVRTVGGQATLLIAEIEPLTVADGEAEPSTEYRLTVHAIGDCCLFVVRDGKKLFSFPMSDSAAYGVGPNALSSIAKDVRYAERFQHFDDRCRPGDLLVMCTDAIGLWAMQEYEAGNHVDWMRYWENEGAWQEDIISLRARGPRDPGARMVVDDCTLLLMEVVTEQEIPDEPYTLPDRSDEPFSLISETDLIVESIPGRSDVPKDCERTPDATTGQSELVDDSTGVAEQSAIATDSVEKIDAGPEAADPGDEQSSPRAEGSEESSISAEERNPRGWSRIFRFGQH